eukprot:s1439_g7.t3
MSVEHLTCVSPSFTRLHKASGCSSQRLQNAADVRPPVTVFREGGWLKSAAEPHPAHALRTSCPSCVHVTLNDARKLVASWAWQWLIVCLACSKAAAWKLRQEVLGNLSSSADDTSCQRHVCGRGWAPKPDHHKRHGNTDAVCCDKTCALWTCTDGYAQNAAYARNVYQSNDMCCDETCVHVGCDKGYKNRGSSVHATSPDACCEVTCELFSCPGNWSQKPGPVRVGNDLETCCAPHCALFDCEALGWEADPVASGRIGSSKTECCKKTCSSWSCPAGYAVPESLRHLDSPSDSKCCRQTYCSAFNCDAGWNRNESAKDQVGHSNEECCIATCSVYTCDASAGWANSPAKKNVVGDGPLLCCEPACSNHTCSKKWVPNKLVWDKPGQADDVCCMKSCELHDCDASLGWKTNGHAAAKPADSDATCCLPTCKRYSCSYGWLADPKTSDKEGASDAECCLKTCRAYSCDASKGWLQDPVSLNKVGEDVSTCCTPSCSLHKCSSGWVANTAKTNTAGDTDEECCLKSCALHSCSGNDPILVKKQGIDDAAGDTDKACCEPADCQEWPRKLVQAEKGCEKVPITQECNGMYEKSTPADDGSTTLSRCGYQYVGGQVFRCGSLDASKLVCGRAAYAPSCCKGSQTEAVSVTLDVDRCTTLGRVAAIETAFGSSNAQSSPPVVHPIERLSLHRTLHPEAAFGPGRHGTRPAEGSDLHSVGKRCRASLRGGCR